MLGNLIRILYSHSFRDYLWLKSDQGLPPEQFSRIEIGLALAVALLIMLSWFGLKRVCFWIAERARPARASAFVLCLVFALAWGIGALDLLGYRSVAMMLLMIGTVSIGSGAYLSWIRQH